MAMNSIDFVTMLPRTVEAAQMQGKEQSQIQNAAQQPGIQFQQKTEHDARQTVESQKSETEEYDMKDGEGKGAYSSRKKKKEQEKKKSKSPEAPRSNSSFDIMV